MRKAKFLAFIFHQLYRIELLIVNPSTGYWYVYWEGTRMRYHRIGECPFKLIYILVCLFNRCLEIQTNFLDLSNMKTIKHLASIFDLLSSRSISISGRIYHRISIFSLSLFVFFSIYWNYSSNTNKTQLISLFVFFVFQMLNNVKIFN